jgi:hypothetical protein
MLLLQVQYFDPVWQIVSILQDPDLQEGFLAAPDVRGVGDDRVYGEMNTGSWYVDTQEEAPEVLVILYI